MRVNLTPNLLAACNTLNAKGFAIELLTIDRNITYIHLHKTRPLVIRCMDDKFTAFDEAFGGLAYVRYDTIDDLAARAVAIS